jgi:Mpv17 / PMP22 family
LTAQSIVTRVALDQFAFTPVILSTFISSLWTLEGAMGDSTPENKNKSILTRLQETLPDVIVANWMLWGPVQWFNFRVVPQKYQVLFANMISLVWNAYLSFSTRGAPPVEAKVEAEILEHAPLPVTLVQRMSSGGRTVIQEE